MPLDFGENDCGKMVGIPGAECFIIAKPGEQTPRAVGIRPSWTSWRSVFHFAFRFAFIEF
jgi:hypothetical protein